MLLWLSVVCLFLLRPCDGALHSSYEVLYDRVRMTDIAFPPPLDYEVEGDLSVYKGPSPATGKLEDVEFGVVLDDCKYQAPLIVLLVVIVLLKNE